MEFKETISKYFEKNDIKINKIEQEGNNKSIVVHINKSDNEKINSIREKMEKDLNVAIVLSDMYGMNVVIVESNNLEKEDSHFRFQKAE